MRKQYRSFRIDRMLTCHELTTPDDVEDEPSIDFEDTAAGRDYR